MEAWHKDTMTSKGRDISPPDIENMYLVGNFDGDAQREEMNYGVGVIIHIDNDQSFHISWNC